jgi:hypothetical protein
VTATFKIKQVPFDGGVATFPWDDHEPHVFVLAKLEFDDGDIHTARLDTQKQMFIDPIPVAIPASDRGKAIAEQVCEGLWA